MPTVSADRPSRPLRVQRRAAVAAAVASLLVAGYLGLHARDQARVRTASELGAERRYPEAVAEARQVTRAPSGARALVVRAHAEQARGRHREAVRLFGRAAARDPRSWSLHRDWAVSLLALGQQADARRQIAIASTLNPRMAAPPGF